MKVCLYRNLIIKNEVIIEVINQSIINFSYGITGRIYIYDSGKKHRKGTSE